MKRFIACIGLLIATGCASTENHSSSAATVRNPSAVQRTEDKCFTVSPIEAVPPDLSVFSYNLNPGDSHNQPEKLFHDQLMTYENITSDLCWLANAVEKRRTNLLRGQSNIAKIHIAHGARSKTYISCHAQNLGIDLRCESGRTGSAEDCYVYGLLEGSSCR